MMMSILLNIRMLRSKRALCSTSSDVCKAAEIEGRDYEEQDSHFHVMV